MYMYIHNEHSDKPVWHRVRNLRMTSYIFSCILLRCVSDVVYLTWCSWNVINIMLDLALFYCADSPRLGTCFCLSISPEITQAQSSFRCRHVFCDRIDCLDMHCLIRLSQLSNLDNKNRLDVTSQYCGNGQSDTSALSHLQPRICKLSTQRVN